MNEKEIMIKALIELYLICLYSLTKMINWSKTCSSNLFLFVFNLHHTKFHLFNFFSKVQ